MIQKNNQSNLLDPLGGASTSSAAVFSSCLTGPSRFRAPLFNRMQSSCSIMSVSGFQSSLHAKKHQLFGTESKRAKGRRHVGPKSASGDQNETKTLEPPMNEEGTSASQEAQAEARERSNLEKIMWGFYAAYVAYMLLLPTGPGLAPVSFATIFSMHLLPLVSLFLETCFQGCRPAGNLFDRWWLQFIDR